MNSLPNPQGWNRRIGRLVFAAVLAGAAAVGFAIKTTNEIGRTHWMAATITTAATMTFLLITAGAFRVITGRGTLDANVTDRGTTFSPSTPVKGFAMLAVCIIVGPALYMLAGSHLGDDLPVPTTKDCVRMTALVLCGIVVLVVLARRARSGRRPVLTLSVQGINFDDLSVRFTVGWDEITDIAASLPKRRYVRPVVLHRGSEPPVAINNASSYVPGGKALFWAIRHYWLHPQDRVELATGAALDRLNSNRITVD